MHDPMTVAWEIRYPWPFPKMGMQDWTGPRHSFITIWHRDPETDGSDDSCDWFGKPKKREHGWYPVHDDDYAALPEEAQKAVDFMLYLLPVRRSWWRHPRWHVHHWRFQIHPLQTLWNWASKSCAICGERFKFREVRNGQRISNWDGDKTWHIRCDSNTLKAEPNHPA